GIYDHPRRIWLRSRRRGGRAISPAPGAARALDWRQRRRLVAARGAARRRDTRSGELARCRCARQRGDFVRGGAMKGRARLPALKEQAVLRPALFPTPTSPVADLYRAHAQTVARWASRLGGPAIDVEDVVQEVFLVVQRRLREFRGEAEITTW